MGAAAAPTAKRLAIVCDRDALSVDHVRCVELDEETADLCASYQGAAPTTGASRFAARLGLEPRQLLVDSRARERWAVADALLGVLTRGGSDRSTRIRNCSRLRVAKRSTGRGDRYGVAAWNCRDRLCPRCGALRAKQRAFALRQFVDGRQAWDRMLFVTLTQVKRDVRDESPEQAIARAGAAITRTFDKKFASGRHLSELLAGALIVLELTWSPKGWRTDGRGDRYFVASSGWHAHVHALVEVREGVKTGFAASRILRTWLAASPGSEPGSQLAKRATAQNVGQLCKYVVKPLSIENPRRLRQAARAVADVHAERARGEWVGWSQRVQHDGAWDRVEVSPHGLPALRDAAIADKWLSWSDGWLNTGAVEARELVRTVAAKPVPLADQVREQRQRQREEGFGRGREPKTAAVVSLAWILSAESSLVAVDSS